MRRLCRRPPHADAPAARRFGVERLRARLAKIRVSSVVVQGSSPGAGSGTWKHIHQVVKTRRAEHLRSSSLCIDAARSGMRCSISSSTRSGNGSASLRVAARRAAACRCRGVGAGAVRMRQSRAQAQAQAPAPRHHGQWSLDTGGRRFCARSAPCAPAREKRSFCLK